MNWWRHTTAEYIFRALIAAENWCMGMEYKFTYVWNSHDVPFYKRLWITLWRIPQFIIDETVYLFFKS